MSASTAKEALLFTAQLLRELGVHRIAVDAVAERVLTEEELSHLSEDDMDEISAAYGLEDDDATEELDRATVVADLIRERDLDPSDRLQ